MHLMLTNIVMKQKNNPNSDIEKADLEQQIIIELNLFAMDIAVNGFGLENHNNFTKRIMEDVEKSLLSIRESTLKTIEENGKRYISERYGTNQFVIPGKKWDRIRDELEKKV